MQLQKYYGILLLITLCSIQSYKAANYGLLDNYFRKKMFSRLASMRNLQFGKLNEGAVYRFNNCD